MSSLNEEVVVAVSGGKDSSIAAWILKELGYRIKLIYFKTPWHNSPPFWLSERLQTPLEVVDIEKEFTKFVVENFARFYLGGLTPNPCAICNRFIKFGALMERISQQNQTSIATGHYAEIELTPETALREYGRDSQSYFLSLVDPGKFKRILLPLSSREMLHKLGLPYPLDQNKVSEIAGSLGFLKQSASRDICFVKSNYRAFLRRYLIEKLGEKSGFAFRGIVLQKENGEKFSLAKNFWEITPGQKFHGEYIIEKKIGSGGVAFVSTSKNINRKVRIKTGNINVISRSAFEEQLRKGKALVRLRYRQRLLLAEDLNLHKNRDTTLKATFTTKTRNFFPAPGQIVTFYESLNENDTQNATKILAGAVIEEVEVVD